MAEYRLSSLAARDLEKIARYTEKTWGARQAYRYVMEFRGCFLRVSANPLLGRSCDRLRQGYRRIEQGSHMIFYRPEARGITVMRILHRKMLPGNYISLE